MHVHRRSFLQRITSTAGVVSLVGGVPHLLRAASTVAQKSTEQKLVVLFLVGGNDGLNTVLPVGDPLYRRYRADTRIEPADALGLDDEMALHPSMRGISDVWEAGRLAIVRGVGYPNHSRSHFVSRAVWHAAELETELQPGNGWLGRSLDARQSRSKAPLAYSVGFSETPSALRGRTTRSAVPPDVGPEEAERLRQLLAAGAARQFVSAKRQRVARVQQDAVSALNQLLEAKALKQDDFPQTELGKQLSQVAWLIRSGNPTCVYYLRHDGYDTHAGQAPRHAALLRQLSEGLRAFDRVMNDAGLDSQVTVMVFSEFGRRVAENESGGTDHGAAGPVFVIGGGYEPGLHGQRPDLSDLDNADVRMTIDFRDVYATVLRHSLGVDPHQLLPKRFQPIAGLHD